jgi:hypothetical protein
MLFLIVCAASFAYAATAQANLLDVIAQDYADDQQINPCKYTEKDLRALKDLVPNDVEAYDAGFSAALDDALARRAEGACKKGGATPQAAAPPAGAAPPPPARGTPPAAAATGAPAVVQPPPKPTAEPTAAPDIAVHDEIGVAARASDPATDAPFPIVALAVFAGLGALGMLLFGLVRWRAWEPAWADRFRHAAGEAGWRASSTWAEFTDFVRFGR